MEVAMVTEQHKVTLTALVTVLVMLKEMVKAGVQVKAMQTVK